MKKIAIIGGGAAGIAAGIAAAQENQKTGRPEQILITVYEASDKVGKTILATGNGRCNYSNAHLDSSLYHNAEFVNQAMRCVSLNEVLDWFSDLGLNSAQESEGRLYPSSFKAHSILDLFRLSLKELGVIEKTNRVVTSITPVDNTFLVNFDDLSSEYADAVILSCGKQLAQSLLPLGFEFIEQQAVLCPLTTQTESIKGLDNIRARVTLKSGGFSEEGEILFRSYGVSGVVVFNASRYCSPGDILSIDFAPSHTSDHLLERFISLSTMHPSRNLADLFLGMLHPRIVSAIAKKAEVEEHCIATRRSIQKFLACVKAFDLVVTGKGDARQAQVFRGGFSVEDVYPNSMQAISTPGLYVVGEALDVDGPCGGYNLHWAWTSGILAGRSVVRGVR